MQVVCVSCGGGGGGGGGVAGSPEQTSIFIFLEVFCVLVDGPKLTTLARRYPRPASDSERLNWISNAMQFRHHCQAQGQSGSSILQSIAQCQSGQSQLGQSHS